MKAPPPPPSRSKKPPPPPTPKVEVKRKAKAKGSMRETWTPCLVRINDRWLSPFMTDKGEVVSCYVDLTKEPHVLTAEGRAGLKARFANREWRLGPYYTVYLSVSEAAAYASVWGGDIELWESDGGLKDFRSTGPLYKPPPRAPVPPPPPPPPRRPETVKQKRAPPPPLPSVRK